MEYSRGQLLSIYEDIEQERKQRDEYISMVQNRSIVFTKILEYRIASVSRILDYIHTKQFDKNFDINYDKLITHCCNKLHGNLDGIEIKLKEEENDN